MNTCFHGQNSNNMVALIASGFTVTVDLEGTTVDLDFSVFLMQKGPEKVLKF